MCVCVSACVCGWVSADVCVCVSVCVGVSMCSWVCGCVCLCLCACWCESREGCVCMCVRACVCMACAYLWFGASHILTPPPPHTHMPSMKANSPPLDPHPHTSRPHTLIRTWTVDVSRFNA